ncbi:nicotinate-nucleotide--dimethylbenzimidazole phosphoribosyltransferase [Streptomyces sp. TR06-5]|uniref:nicotinate-nucleotide--dimethylbenzimidazole phosphoribosyltransferase n=1 Tax=unclassified Streptomyces TaxID=2593676 RepID=UPI00399F641D
MTDTGRFPGEEQPGHADAEAQQPHAAPAAHGAYAAADPEVDQSADVGDDEDLLMPGAQGAWGEGQSGSSGMPSQQSAQPWQSASSTGAPRRPLHLGPPVPEQSGAVRTLADRGPSSPPTAGRPQNVAHVAVPPPAPEDEPMPAVELEPQPDVAPVQPAPPEMPPAPQPAESGPAPGDEAVRPMEDAPEAGSFVHTAPPESPGAAAPYAAAAEAAMPLPGAFAGEQGPAAEAVQEPVVPEPPAARNPVPVTGVEDPAPADRADPAPVVAPSEGADAATGEDGPAPHAESASAHAEPDGAAPDPQPGAPAVAEEAPQEAAGDPAEPEGPVAVEPLPEALPADDGEGAPSPAADPAAPEIVQEAEQAGLPDDSSAPAPDQAASPPGAGLPGDVAGAARSPGEAPDTEPADAVPPLEDEDVSVEAPAEHRAPDSAPADLPEDAVHVTATAPAEEQAVEEPVVEEQAPAASGDATADDSEDGPAAPEDAAETSDGHAPEEGTLRSHHEEDLPSEPDDGAPQDPAGPGATGPAPGYDEAEREAVHRLMRERRDVRNGFRPDPIPHDVLLRVLEAAHTAPSVGHSQPWDFVVIRSEQTRRSMHELAVAQREAYAKSLPKARAKQFKELKIEAILDTPVNIVVTADPTRGGRHTLGRHTQPQMAPYSSALAVENLWLAARAEGLGVGWVSFFDEREMVRVLELPEHLEVVAYLCIGYVDEFPSEPELMQAGWSKRRPLSWVVHEESYGRRALPGAEPHDLLAETLERIRPLDAKALGEAWERQKRMTKPAGALGMLEIISAQLCGLSRQCPPPVPEPAAVAVFAGDHGVHAQGVTPWAQEVTGQMVGNFLNGGAVCNAFAAQVGAEVCVVDVGVAAELPTAPGLLPRKVRAGTADMTQGPALSQEEVLRAVEVGIETARDLVAAGNKALVTGEMGIANTTASAALIAACTGADPAEVTGRGTGIDDDTHARKVEVVRRALELHRPDPSDPIGMLAAIGGLEHAALTGLILGGASLRTPVLLDGVSAGAAALVARQITPEALAACIAGHRSAEPGHVAALTKLGLRPLIDLDLRLGEGTGALLALPLVQSAARAMHEVATFDSAGVTEKN